MLYHPNFDPVAFALGPVKVHWYGLMYLLSFGCAWAFARYRANKHPWRGISAAQTEDLIFWGAVGVVAGGRFGYVFFYQFSRFLQEPLWLFKIWDGGMSFHGGLVGVLLVIWWFSRRIKRPTGEVYDFVAVMVPIGLFFGRIGNFIGQELYGRVTDASYGMVFFTDPSRQPRHPSQLYQAFTEGLLLFVILLWFSSQPRPRWATGAIFLLGYGSFRFLVEFTRQPDSHIGFDLFGWMTRGQLLCLPMIIAGAALLVWAYKNPRYPELDQSTE